MLTVHVYSGSGTRKAHFLLINAKINNYINTQTMVISLTGSNEADVRWRDGQMERMRYLCETRDYKPFRWRNLACCFLGLGKGF